VVRHLQASEKDRAGEKANEIRQLKSQVSHYLQAQKNAEGVSTNNNYYNDVVM